MFAKLSGGVGLAAFLLLGACATPGQPDVAPRAAGPTPIAVIQSLPVQLGSFQQAEPSFDYEAQPGGAGYGASVRYVPSNGERMRATVYVFDKGRVRQPDGAGSPDVDDELQAALGEAQSGVRMGMYGRATPGEGMEIRDNASKQVNVRCVTFGLVQRDGSETGDAACVTIRNGRFVKVRMTIWDPPVPAGAGMMAASLIGQVVAALPPR